MPSFVTTLAVGLIPALAAVIGGIVVLVRTIDAQTESYIQHFAAGAVFAAVTAEVLLKLHDRTPWIITVGFIVGVGLMIAVETGTDRLEQRTADQQATSIAGLLITMGIDTVIDGLLGGLAVTALSGGLLLVIALAIEMLFFGLSAAAALPSETTTMKLMMVVTGLGLLFPVGTILGTVVFSNLSGSALGLVLAIGAIALLYLVTEELLAEAHEAYESSVAVSLFFTGFILLFVLDMIR